MKCPKCEYLGFDTGTRCRNCGYDFSLVGAPAPTADLQLHQPDRHTPASTAWLDQFALNNSAASPAAASGAGEGRPTDRNASPPMASAPGPMAGRERAAGAALPLFAPALDDDEPLIKVPAAPRAPLAVRRTPDTPRLRAVAKATPRRVEVEPALDFPDEAAAPAVEAPAPAPDPAPAEPKRYTATAVDTSEAGSAAARLLAALLDHGLLLAIDATVLYFTLRIAGLSPSDWALLPPVPVVVFLGLIKVGYFAAFTAIGGQTIGKMAAGIAVVADGGQRLDPGRSVKRSLAGAVSLLVAGLGFVPALVGPDRRALHDRVAGTRVVVRSS